MKRDTLILIAAVGVAGAVALIVLYALDKGLILPRNVDPQSSTAGWNWSDVSFADLLARTDPGNIYTRHDTPGGVSVWYGSRGSPAYLPPATWVETQAAIRNKPINELAASFAPPGSSVIQTIQARVAARKLLAGGGA